MDKFLFAPCKGKGKRQPGELRQTRWSWKCSFRGAPGTFPLPQGIPELRGSADAPGASPTPLDPGPPNPSKGKEWKMSKCVWKTLKKAEFQLVLKTSLSGEAEELFLPALCRGASALLFREILLIRCFTTQYDNCANKCAVPVFSLI